MLVLMDGLLNPQVPLVQHIAPPSTTTTTPAAAAAGATALPSPRGACCGAGCPHESRGGATPLGSLSECHKEVCRRRIKFGALELQSVATNANENSLLTQGAYMLLL